MSDTTVAYDMNEWLPPWGEFDLRYYWEDLAFCIEVDYEVGEPQEADKPIFTKLIQFDTPIAVLNSWWPLPLSLSLGPTGSAGWGQIIDLGATALWTDCMFQFRRGDRSFLPELHHYYVYFGDMKQTFQIVAESVEVTDIDPPPSDG